jgi:hypothetical protein
MAVGMYERFPRAVSWLRLFVIDLSPWRPTFDPSSVHVLFFWSKRQWDTFFPEYFGVCFASIIPPMLHNHTRHCYQMEQNGEYWETYK